MAIADPKELANQNRGAGAYSTPGVDTRAINVPFVPLTSRPAVRFALHDVDPPSTLYLEETDLLQMVILNSAASTTTVSIAGRFLRASDGAISPFSIPVAVTSNRVPNIFSFHLGEGYVIGLCVIAGDAERGECFAYVSVAHGQAPSTAFTLDQLIQDYASNYHNPKWPGGEFISSIEGPGIIRSITGTVPGPGAEISEAVPTSARWRLLAFRYSLTTAIAAANRESALQEDDGANVFMSEPSGFTQIASLTHTYNFGTSGTRYESAQSLETQAQITDSRLLAGHRIRTKTTNIQGADQYTAPQYLVEEWIEN